MVIAVFLKNALKKLESIPFIRKFSYSMAIEFNCSNRKTCRAKAL